MGDRRLIAEVFARTQIAMCLNTCTPAALINLSERPVVSPYVSPAMVRIDGMPAFRPMKERLDALKRDRGDVGDIVYFLAAYEQSLAMVGGTLSIAPRAAGVILETYPHVHTQAHRDYPVCVGLLTLLAFAFVTQPSQHYWIMYAFDQTEKGLWMLVLETVVSVYKADIETFRNPLPYFRLVVTTTLAPAPVFYVPSIDEICEPYGSAPIELSGE